MTFPYDRSAQLTLANSDFVRDLERFFIGAYESDMAHSDVTTGALTDRPMHGRFVAKSEGRFCGGPLLEWFLGRVAPELEAVFNVKEGAAFAVGDVLFELKGSGVKQLHVERTLLNMVQRLSGICTTTALYAEAARPARVAATRKTLYGRLDKYAVAIGGGLTHRLTLGDAPLIKENHIVLEGGMEALVATLPTLAKGRPFLTVEVENEKEANALLAHVSQLTTPLIVLFDNWTSEALAAYLSKTPKPSNVFWEASGGIRLETLHAYVQTGVDVLSTSALTSGNASIDVSFLFEA